MHRIVRRAIKVVAAIAALGCAFLSPRSHPTLYFGSIVLLFACFAGWRLFFSAIERERLWHWLEIANMKIAKAVMVAVLLLLLIVIIAKLAFG